MRIFLPGHNHDAIAQHLRREAMKGFQRGGDPATDRYVQACACGVNLPEVPNSVSLVLTRDNVPECKVGWHLSVCCVTNRGYREFVPAEGEYWRAKIFGQYADRAEPQPLKDRSSVGVEKDVRHWVIECVWTDRGDPAVNLEGLPK